MKTIDRTPSPSRSALNSKLKRIGLMLALSLILFVAPRSVSAAIVGISQTGGNLNTLWLSDGWDANSRTFTTALGEVPALNSASLQILDFADNRVIQGARPYGSLISSDLSSSFYRFGADPGLTTLIYGGAEFLLSDVFRNNAQNGTDNYVGYRMLGSDSQYYYGWLQFELNQFVSGQTAIRFINGVIESAPNTSFAATSVAPSAIPEPGTWAAAALLAIGAGYMRWRNRSKTS